jgi:hypothetical protein
VCVRCDCKRGPSVPALQKPACPVLCARAIPIYLALSLVGAIRILRALSSGEITIGIMASLREGVSRSDEHLSKTYWYRREAPPDLCLEESCVMGIGASRNCVNQQITMLVLGHFSFLNDTDEAGRGAAIGPMTYGAAYWAESVHDEMCALNFDVSSPSFILCRIDPQHLSPLFTPSTLGLH